MIITIDGPSGTGKTTVAKKVAERLHFAYFDTGAMYRAVTWAILKANINLADEERLQELLNSFSFRIQEGDTRRYFVGQQDVTDEIRSQRITGAVSAVSALPIVRNALWKIQKAFAQRGNAVFEGRDLGTVVFPEAEVKIFLTAQPEVRAKRRLSEMKEIVNQEEMLQDIMRRDTLDSTRKVAPLKCPEDAYVIDTSNLTIDEVVDRIIDYVKKKKKKPSILYRSVLFTTRLFFKIFHQHRVYGLEHFYPGGAILSANHASFFDPPILAISWPEEVHFLARESLFKNPLFGKFIAALNSHPISGDASDIKLFRLIENLIKEGKKVILFPEGARGDHDALQPLKGGVGFLLSRTQAAVIPAYIHGTYQIWNRQRRFPKLFGKTACVFGSPILYSSFAHLDKRAAQEAITQKLADSIQALRKWYEAGAHGIPP